MGGDMIGDTLTLERTVKTQISLIWVSTVRCLNYCGCKRRGTCLVWVCSGFMGSPSLIETLLSGHDICCLTTGLYSNHCRLWRCSVALVVKWAILNGNGTTSKRHWIGVDLASWRWNSDDSVSIRGREIRKSVLMSWVRRQINSTCVSKLLKSSACLPNFMI